MKTIQTILSRPGIPDEIRAKIFAVQLDKVRVSKDKFD